LSNIATVTKGQGMGLCEWSVEHHLNTTAFLSIVADHVHPFMTSVPWLLQQDNAPSQIHFEKCQLPYFISSSC